jgi:hypothetical protein
LTRGRARARRLSPFQIVAGHTALALVLAGRAVVNALFALWLWNIKPSWSEFFAGGASYLVMDGVLGVLAAIILSFGVLGEAPVLLTAATGGDGALRILAAVALWTFPGLPDFPVTAVAFFAIIGGCAVCLALVAVTIRIRVWRLRHLAHESTPLAMHEELDPVFLAGIVAVVLVGYAFFAGPPVTAADYRLLGIRWASALAIAFAIAAFGVKAPAHPRRD